MSVTVQIAQTEMVCVKVSLISRIQIMKLGYLSLLSFTQFGSSGKIPA